MTDPTPTDPNLPPDFNDILNQAGAATDQQLNDVITTYTNLTASQLNDLALTADEKLQLVKLMQAVQNQIGVNNQVAAVMSIIGQVGPIVIKLALQYLLPLI